MDKEKILKVIKGANKIEDSNCAICGNPAKYLMHVCSKKTYDLYEIAWNINSNVIDENSSLLVDNNIIITYKSNTVCVLVGKLEDLTKVIRILARDEYEDIEFIETLITQCDHVPVCENYDCIGTLIDYGFVSCGCGG